MKKDFNDMKGITLIFSVLLFAVTVMQAQTAKGPVRTTSFTVSPSGDGYEVKVTLKYRFQICAGSITLDGFRSAHEPLAYWYEGKRYEQSAVKCPFKTKKDDLYMNLDFTADIYNEFSEKRVGSGKWVWVNLSDWGGCLGDYGDGGFKYNTSGISGNVQDYLKGILPFFYLKNIKPKDEPQRDYEIEECISGKKEPKGDWVEINGVKWATKNFGGDNAFYTYNEAKRNAPQGWRLPTKKEIESLFNSPKEWTGKGFSFANGKLFLPGLGVYSSKTGKIEWTDIYLGFYHVEDAEMNFGRLGHQFTQDYYSNSDGNKRNIRYVKIEDYVEINGVKWATKNIGKSGQFVEKPEDFGGYFTHEEALKICPGGWKLPTKTEYESLIKTENKRINSGLSFANGKLFFPATGLPDSESYKDLTHYWCSDYNSSTYPAVMYFNKNGSPSVFQNDKNMRFSVRCALIEKK